MMLRVSALLWLGVSRWALFGLIALVLLPPGISMAQGRALSEEQQQALRTWIETRTTTLNRAAEARLALALADTASPTAAPAGLESASNPAGAATPPPTSTAPDNGDGITTPPTSGIGDLALLIEVLNDPARREALIALLRAAGADPSVMANAADATLSMNAPGPGVGPGTGIAAAMAGDTGSGPAPPIAAPDLSALTAYLHDRYQRIVWSSGVTTQVPQLLDWVALQFDDDMRGQWVSLLWQLGLVILVGFLAVLLGRLMVHGLSRQWEEKARQTAAGRRVVLLVTRLVLKLVPILLFAVAAQAALPLIDANLRTELVAAAVVTSLVLQRASTVMLWGLLSPRDTVLRLLPLGDEIATIVYRVLRLIAPAVIFGYLAVEVARLFAMPPGSRLLLAHLVGLLVMVFTIRLVFQLRATVKRAIRAVNLGNSTATAWVTGLQRGFADIWHLLASVYVVVIYVAWVLDSERWFSLAGWATLKTMGLVVAALVALGWVQALRDATIVRLHGQNRFDRQMRERGRRYLGLAAGTARTLIGLGCLVLILESWSVGALGWLTQGLGARAVTMAFNLGLVLAVALALWEGVNYAIKRYLTTTDSQGRVIERGQRERTLLPLLRNVLSVFLVVVVTLILLSELGLDIAPLLAGAGVVGLAIGFGSQKLVQDVITGIFNLLEDTIAVGDVIQVGGHAGVVEAMSIRSLRLRDLSGNLHTIPFSGVDTVTNMTKDYSYYLMDIRIAYRESTDEVSQIIKDVGAALQDDPEYGPSILEPVEVLGVDGFKDSAVLIKARIKTRPIMQWWVGREYNRRLKMRFDERGIEIPFPHTTVYFGVDKEGNAPPAHLHVDRLAAMGARARAAAPSPVPRPPSTDNDPADRTALLPDPDGEAPADGR